MKGARHIVDSTGVPLDVIAEILRAAIGGVDRDGNVLSFVSNVGNTQIEVRSLHVRSVESDEISDVVLIRTELPESLGDLPERQVVLTNKMAALGAMVREQKTGRISVVSRLSVYAGDDDAWKLYVGLVTFASLLQGTALLASLGAAVGHEVARPDLPGRDDDSEWSEQDFTFAAERLKQIGLLATSDKGGLTAEIPLKSGGISWATGDETGLLTFETDMRHPTLGSGLFHKLELPIQFEEDVLIELANALNRSEVEAVHSPPFFGAWCSQLKSGRLAYVGFWPNVLYAPGTVLNIASWMIPRQSQALDIIGRYAAPAVYRPVTQVKCWSCKQLIQVPDDKRGRKVACPICGTKQMLPR